MLSSKKKRVFLLVIACFEAINCKCRQSYITICDTFDDFKQYNDSEGLSEVLIGSEHGNTNMTSANLMNDLKFSKYHKLSSISIIGAINNLESEYGYQCTYYRSRPLDSFILYGNVLKNLHSYLFPLVFTKKMSLVNNQIESVKAWTFRSHPIEHLDLSNNLLEVLESESLPLDEKSKIVTIRNNKLTHIEAGCFSSSLESLNLDHNKLRYLQDEVFDGLINLKELTVSHNKFNVFPKIDHLKKLIIFDISHNAISTLKQDAFKDMDDLKLVDLSNNEISTNSVLEWIITPRKQPTLTISLALNRLRHLDLDKVSLQNQTLVLYGNPWDCNGWPELKKKLTGHESECDTKFLSSGNVPYCINYRVGGYPFVSLWERDIDMFHETVKSSEKKAGCVLAPQKHGWLHSISFGCVA